jgi:hypothetical protein
MLPNSVGKLDGSRTIQKALTSRDQDRLHNERQFVLSHPTHVSKELVDRQQMLALFASIQEDPSQMGELVPVIYHAMRNLPTSPSEHAFFDDNLPFQAFLAIAMDPCDEDVQSMAVQILDHASGSQFFPLPLFANQPVLAFLIGLLDSLDQGLCRSSLGVLSNTIGRSVDSRDFALEVGLIQKAEAFSNSSISYVLGELLLSVCHTSPPPAEPFVAQIVEVQRAILVRSTEDLPILGVVLESVLWLLKNRAPGASADMFVEFLPHFLLSGVPSIVPASCALMLFLSEIPPELCTILIEILATEEQPAALRVIAQVLVRFLPIFQPICGHRIFELLLSKVGATLYNVEVACLRAAIEYFDGEFASNMDVFRIFLRFAASEEIGQEAMTVLEAMVRTAGNAAVKREMMAELADSMHVFEELTAGENEEVATIAEQFIGLINAYAEEDAS